MKNLLFIVSIVFIGVAGISGCGSGETGNGETDIRKVIAEPEAYAGQTLTSLVIMEDPSVFRGIGAAGAMPLFLMASPSLKEKAMNILQSIGEYQAVAIKYRIHDKATFAEIRTYLAASEQAYAEEERILDDSSGGESAIPLAVFEKVEKMREARAAARVREVGEKDPADYSGVLLDIWIP